MRSLSLDPRMIMSMEILQLPRRALWERVHQEIQDNPVLAESVSEPASPPGAAKDVLPDAVVERDEHGEYTVRVLDDWLLSISIRHKLIDLDHENDSNAQTREYLNRKIAAAQWLQESIEQRCSTLEKVANAIIQHQRAFLDRGPEYIVPLKMRQIADQIKIPVTTVSRAVYEKWLQTSQDLVPFRRFFESAEQANKNGKG
jgi:RNA polymerase sigma-54 factor